MRKTALELGRISIPDFVFFRISSSGLSRCRPSGHLQYTVHALTLSTASAWTTMRTESPTTRATCPVCRGNCRADALFPLKTKGQTTSHMSASRPDLPQNLRLPGESWRRYRVKDITFCGKSGRSASHDMWELVQRRIPPAADDGFHNGFQPSSTAARLRRTPLARLPSSLRPVLSLATVPNRSRRVPFQEVAAAEAELGPCHFN